MVKLSYHSPQFPPINRRDAKANVSEFFYSPFFCSGFANGKMQDGKILTVDFSNLWRAVSRRFSA
jgi:hypothetical protein